MSSSIFFYSLLIITLFSFPLIQARESQFFSKFTHFSTITTQQIDQPISSTPTSSPILSAPTPAPAPSPTEFPTDNNTANGDEMELLDEEFENGSQSSNTNNNNDNNGYKVASESHETADRNGYEEGEYKPVSTSSSRETVANGEKNNYNGDDKFEKESQRSNNYGYKLASDSRETADRNGYGVVRTSSSNEGGYEPVSTSSSRDIVANGEKNSYNGDDKFEKDQSSNNNGYKLASESRKSADWNGYGAVSTSSSNEGGYEPVSTSSSRETSANGEKNNYNDDETELFDDKFEKESQRSINNNYGYKLASESHENPDRNGYGVVSTSSSNEGRYERVSSSSSRETVANGEKNNYNGDTANSFSYNGNNENEEKERKGMSDTRFMENGKYYYDLQKENNENYYPVAKNGYNYAQNHNYGNKNENGFNTKMGFENEEIDDESLP